LFISLALPWFKNILKKAWKLKIHPPATWEVEIGGLPLEVSLGKKLETIISKTKCGGTRLYFSYLGGIGKRIMVRG
jgi:hypothetical protein